MVKRFTLAALLALGLIAVAYAVQPTNNNGAVVAAPYQFTPLGGAQWSQTSNTASALTAPTGAAYARICAVGGQMNYTDTVGDTPTSGVAPTVGTPLAAGSCVPESGPAMLAAFQIINATASTGTWQAAYSR